MAETTAVTIKRGSFNTSLQLVRALISAASAELTRDRDRTVLYLDRAINELVTLRHSVAKASTS
jgi:hypothetical protein